MNVNFKPKTDFERVLFLRNYVDELKKVIEKKNKIIKQQCDDILEIKENLQLSAKFKDLKLMKYKMELKELRKNGNTSKHRNK
jgi:hypothetical protein